MEMSSLAKSPVPACASITSSSTSTIQPPSGLCPGTWADDFDSSFFMKAMQAPGPARKLENRA